MLVSHDLGSVIKYCDRVILLNSGQFVGQGNSKEMVDIYKQIMVNQYNEQQDSQDTNDDNLTDLKDFGNEETILKERLLLSNDILEYGNGNAEIIDFAVIDNKNNITSQLLKGKNFRIYMKVKFNVQIEDPIMAFTIKDLKGTELTGTNTQIEKCEVGNPEAGSTYTVYFDQMMNLQGGEYLLSLGCTGFNQNDFVVYHRLYDVVNISVISDKNTVGYFDSNSIVSIEGVNA